MKQLNIKINLILAAIMLSLMFVGCGKDDDNTKPTTNDAPFTFLKVGNEWEYESYYDGIPDDTWKMKIISESNGYYIVEYDGYHYRTWYSNGNYWKIITDDETNYGPIILNKNCYVGQKWDTTVSNGYATSKVTTEVLSISETITVPAGTFTRCIKVKVEENSKYTWNGEEVELKILAYFYIHKNIGTVMMEVIEGPVKGVVSKLINKNF